MLHWQVSKRSASWQNEGTRKTLEKKVNMEVKKMPELEICKLREITIWEKCGAAPESAWLTGGQFYQCTQSGPGTQHRLILGKLVEARYCSLHTHTPTHTHKHTPTHTLKHTPTPTHTRTHTHAHTHTHTHTHTIQISTHESFHTHRIFMCETQFKYLGHSEKLISNQR